MHITYVPSLTATIMSTRNPIRPPSMKGMAVLLYTAVVALVLDAVVALVLDAVVALVLDAVVASVEAAVGALVEATFIIKG